MPKENKHSRGRRGEDKKSKRKRDNDVEDDHVSKRQKSQDPADREPFFVDLEGNNGHVPMGEEHEGEFSGRPFYGMLEEEEQEYFRRADEMLELNDFPSDEDRSLFLANVYREAEGKELKIACSQSCSRLMERLILLGTVEQKKSLFGKFADNYVHLIQHRFASHCCETLFVQSAQVVTNELTADSKRQDNTAEEGADAPVTMESLFLQTLDELEGAMSFLLTDKYASHTLRVLLVILSGRPIEKAATKTLLQSKRKEKITVTGFDTAPTELTLNKRSVPSSFQFAVEKIISDTIATMDTAFVRILATHPTGNPTLQLLLELELTIPNSRKGANSDQKTIMSALLPGDLTEEGDAQTFINGLLYEPIGSRLLETICTFAPGKLFKQIYKTIFKDRIAAISRNEISSYVAIKVLTRLSKEDLEQAVESILPQIEGLVARNRTVIIKTLLERCHVRGVDMGALTASIAEAYRAVYIKALLETRLAKGADTTAALTASIGAEYDSKPELLLLRMACIDDIDSLIVATTIIPAPAPAEGEEASTPNQPQQPKGTPSQLHGSLLAQFMLTLPGAPSTLIQTSFLALPSRPLLALALYTTTSHILQSALSPTVTNTIPFRRKLINTLLFPAAVPTYTSTVSNEPSLALALSSTGSHVLDAVRISTSASPPNSTSVPLFSLLERACQILINHEPELRESWPGRIVWRNFSLDLFKRRRGDWIKKVKASALEAAISHDPTSASTPAPIEAADDEEKDEKSADAGGKVNPPGSKQARKKQKGFENRMKRKEEKEIGPKKSAIQLAREKFAAAKAVGANGKTTPIVGKKGFKPTGANATLGKRKASAE